MRNALGLRRGTVSLQPHDPAWEAEGAATVARLKRILRDAAVDIRHVGGTAVRGIPAKPIIDIAVGAADFDSVMEKAAELAENGFIYRGQDLPGQLLFVCTGADFRTRRIDDSADYRTHHIHIVKYGSEEWHHYLDLRDYLNTHAEDAQALAALKQTLAERFPEDRAAYTEGKSGLIAELLRKAEAWRRETERRHGMDAIWEEMVKAARAVFAPRKISDYVTAGEVAAAVRSKSGRIYVGVCVDTCSSLGICAERSAIFAMLTAGEQEIDRVCCITPDGRLGGAPCGACRELMVQLMPGKYHDILILTGEDGSTVRLGDMTPGWWIK